MPRAPLRPSQGDRHWETAGHPQSRGFHRMAPLNYSRTQRVWGSLSEPDPGAPHPGVRFRRSGGDPGNNGFSRCPAILATPACAPPHVLCSPPRTPLGSRKGPTLPQRPAAPRPVKHSGAPCEALVAASSSPNSSILMRSPGFGGRRETGVRFRSQLCNLAV